MSAWLGRHVGRHVMVLVAVALAAASCLLVPPSAAYLDYLEGRTLMSLFAMMAAIQALDGAHVPAALAERAVRALRTRRAVITALVALAMVASMLLTNDVALLTLLPLSWLVLAGTGNEDRVAFTFVMQAAAANLGGMITPFGSPQNLVLYQRFDLEFGEFVAVMALPFALSVVLVLGPCLLVPNAPIRPTVEVEKVPGRRALVAAALFLVAIAVVLRWVPVWAGWIVPAVLLVADPRALRRVDYGLLATFVAFFVFAGNLARSEAVRSTLSDLLSEHVLLWSAAASQVMSNVPTAILFAHFTDDWRPLLVGVNVGGVGTIVASLASLIALRQYTLHRPGRSREFLTVFTVVNAVLLVILVAAMQAAFAAGLI